MTPAAVAHRVREMELVTDDRGFVSSLERSLFLELLESIAEGSCEDPEGCAEAAVRHIGKREPVEVQVIPCPRWTPVERKRRR